MGLGGALGSSHPGSHPSSYIRTFIWVKNTSFPLRPAVAMYSRWSQQSQPVQILPRGGRCTLIKPLQSLQSSTSSPPHPRSFCSGVQAFCSAPPSIGRSHSDPLPSQDGGGLPVCGTSCPLCGRVPSIATGFLPTLWGFPLKKRCSVLRAKVSSFFFFSFLISVS